MTQEEIKRAELEFKESQQQILTESLTRLDDLLTKAEGLQLDNQLDRWIIHHCMLNEIPLMETLLKLCNYDKTEQVIDRIKKIAENLAPVSNVAAYG